MRRIVLSMLVAAGYGLVGASGASAVPANGQAISELGRLVDQGHYLALQLPFLEISESMGDHDSQIMDAGGVD
jgi:hypothetical protein